MFESLFTLHWLNFSNYKLRRAVEMFFHFFHVNTQIYPDGRSKTKTVLGVQMPKLRPCIEIMWLVLYYFQITLMLVVDAGITLIAWLPRSISLVYTELNIDQKDINFLAGNIYTGYAFCNMYKMPTQCYQSSNNSLVILNISGFVQHDFCLIY